jgi:hypothetical protein
MKSRHLLLLYSVFFLVSCNPKTDTESGFSYQPEVELITNELKFTDIVDEYKYVKLETNDSCLIGNVKQLLIHESKIYVLSDGVFCFNMDGKFLFSILQKGRGPGEFLKIENIGIDDDRLYLVSTRKILFYNSNSGEYLKSINTEYYITYLYLYGNNMYMDVLSNPQNKPDKIGRFYSSQLDDQKVIEGILPDISNKFMSSPFVTYNKCLYYTDPLLVQVYKVHNKTIEPYIYFNFGDQTPTTADVEKLLSVTPRTFNGYEKAINLVNVFETKSTITGAVSLNRRPHYIIFDKKSDKAIAFDFYKNMGRETYQILGSQISAAYEDYFYAVIPVPMIMSSIKKLRDEETLLDSSHPENKNLISLLNTEMNDNPIIAMYKFRSPLDILKRTLK